METEMRKYGGQPFISFRVLAKASGVNRQTIMANVRQLENMK
jgi:hypothetical protein